MILVKNKPDRLRTSEAGLTLIECLVAIAVMAITVAAIAPMVVFSVATRVQNQKTAQALLMAQGEIDKVRLAVEQGGDFGSRLQNDLYLLSAPAAVTNVSEVGAPTTFQDDPANVANVNQAWKVDADGDGDDDFAIQLFRTQGVELAADDGGAIDNPVAFEVGVRVYDARSEANLGALETEESGLAFTSGEGERGNRPLAVLYSQVTQGDRNGSLCQYWEFTEDAGVAIPASLSCN